MRDQVETVRWLAAQGLDPNAQAAEIPPPLVIAVRRGSLPMIEMLLEVGASPRLTDPMGNSPLLLAVSAGFDPVVRLLLSRGADVNQANDRGRTPLDVARREGQSAIVTLLEGRGAKGGPTLPAPQGPHLGQTPPGTTPMLFAPDFVSTEKRELNAAFSPDGREFYFARDRAPRGTAILVTKRQGEGWTVPAVASFSEGSASDVDVFITSDGRQAYFCSNRPGPGTRENGGQTVVRGAANADIWVASRADGGWGDPQPLGRTVNSDGDDYYPTVARDGTLYFSSNRQGSLGANDIYRSCRDEQGRWATPENLGAPVNTPGREFDPLIGPDQSWLIFASERSGGLGAADLYVSFRKPDGSWGEPKNVGPPVNTSESEYTPVLSPDGRYLFFTRGRSGYDDIYWVEARVIGALAQAPPAVVAGDIFALVRSLDSAGSKGLWPGFDPATWPVAVYDGEGTFLLRHPNPPSEFAPMPDRPGVWFMPGRHPAVVANSTREIGGKRTATVLALPGRNPTETLLACVEEVFHVFWLAHHPAFRPNEMARYAYPVKDQENLLRLLAEDEALARALDSEAEAEASGWAAAALRIRRERTSRLDAEARAYETALEMMEGTANYVARRAADEGPGRTSARMRERRPAEGIRWRFYDTGAALCWLLDRLDPGWKALGESQPDLTTVEILQRASARRNAPPKEWSDAETAGFRARAAAEVEDLAGRQERLWREILDRPGPRVVIEVAEGAEPFRPERFDPINLSVLGAGEVAHPHFITLVGPSGSIDLTNAGFARGSYAGTVGLTASAGWRPLGDGIRRLTVVGIQGAPQISHDGKIVLTAPGLRVELRGADLRVDGETIRITVPPPSSPDRD
jgi:hypothetical protein